MKTNHHLLQVIQEALARDSNLRACLDNIYILVNDGAVIIAGSVKQKSFKKLVTRIISETPGVEILIDDLRVEPIPRYSAPVKIDWAKELANEFR